ncbi:MAG: response regulator, partial [Alphaproteobacteria bacterium]|nr:response regulator [Alphaproteobacteria bacterium]
EIALVLGDGQVLPAAISARAMDYHQERAVVLGLYDLSERKSAEAQIAKQQEALQQSEKMAALGGLLAGVAHELNNPLSVIVGQATLLGETAGDDKTKSRAEKIFKAAERCSRIVKSFLSIARRKPPERKEMQLNDIVPSALDLLAYQIRHENVTLEQQLAPHLPRMIGDHDQLVQVLTNLVLNAVQAMDGWKGPKNITIRSWYDAGDYRVNLAVSDTGPGVPAHIRTRIFEPFFTTKAPGTGTGVGLSLCLNIVEAHGGRLMLEDTAGGGATFVLCMPVAERRTKDAATTDDALTQPLSPLKILLVDDELELAQTLADMLSPEGHRFDFAINGQIALEKMAAEDFDLVISDLRMPVLDGPAMHAKLVAQQSPYLQKIIFVTGDTLTPHVREFIEGQQVSVIEKPYTLADIRAAMVACLRATGRLGHNATAGESGV